MAKNLRVALSDADILTVYDINKETIKAFVKEVAPAKVQVASSARDLAEKSVRKTLICSLQPKTLQDKISGDVLFSTEFQHPSETEALTF